MSIVIFSKNLHLWWNLIPKMDSVTHFQFKNAYFYICHVTVNSLKVAAFNKFCNFRIDTSLNSNFYNCNSTSHDFIFQISLSTLADIFAYLQSGPKVLDHWGVITSDLPRSPFSMLIHIVLARTPLLSATLKQEVGRGNCIWIQKLGVTIPSENRQKSMLVL